MLLKEEFAANMGYLEPSINAMIEAGEGNIIFPSKNHYKKMLFIIIDVCRTNDSSCFTRSAIYGYSGWKFFKLSKHK
jgi:hypothetical protein